MAWKTSVVLNRELPSEWGALKCFEAINRSKVKNHMNISTGGRRSFDKNSTSNIYSWCCCFQKPSGKTGEGGEARAHGAPQTVGGGGLTVVGVPHVAGPGCVMMQGSQLSRPWGLLSLLKGQRLGKWENRRSIPTTSLPLLLSRHSGSIRHRHQMRGISGITFGERRSSQHYL